MPLVSEIKRAIDSPVSEKVEKRLSEFNSFEFKNNKEWFSELCFCILTANSKARTAMNIQNELGNGGFEKLNQGEVSYIIRKHKHRFHNNKAKFIVEAREHLDIKDKIQKIVKENGEKEAREWLVENIKGLGYKEASHFLRNVGYTNLAILDRHILNLMVENGYLESKPLSLNKNNYLEIEEKFSEIANEMKMSNAELDLYMWHLKTGEVLK